MCKTNGFSCLVMLKEDLLCPETSSVEIRGTSTNDISLHPVREEVVTNPLHVRAILNRGESSRSVGQTDWNEWVSLTFCPLSSLWLNYSNTFVYIEQFTGGVLEVIRFSGL